MSTIRSLEECSPAGGSRGEEGEVSVAPAGDADRPLLCAWVAGGALGPPPPAAVLRGAPCGSFVRVGLARRAAGGPPLGFVRVDLGPGEAEVSLFVDPVARGAGVARRMLAWALEQAGPRRLYALIERGNRPAEALFSSLSFQDAGTGPGSRSCWVQAARGSGYGEP